MKPRTPPEATAELRSVAAAAPSVFPASERSGRSPPDIRPIPATPRPDRNAVRGRGAGRSALRAPAIPARAAAISRPDAPARDRPRRKEHLGGSAGVAAGQDVSRQLPERGECRSGPRILGAQFDAVLPLNGEGNFERIDRIEPEAPAIEAKQRRRGRNLARSHALQVERLHQQRGERRFFSRLPSRRRLCRRRI